MHGRMNECMEGWRDEWMHGGIEGRMDECMHGWMNACMDG